MLSVQELLENPALGLTCLAGQAGAVRLIGWAHTVELPEPWHWLSASDLLMTTGLGLPAEPDAQVHWLRQLAKRKVSALLLACPSSAPALSKAMLQTAEQLAFPLLQADFSLEFARLSRLVIGHVLRAERRRFAAVEGLFQLWARALHEQSTLSERLNRAADYLQLYLVLEESDSGQSIACSYCAENPPESAQILPMGERSQARLRLWPRDAQTLNPAAELSLLLRALVGLLTVELERLMLERDAQRREGAALLQQLLQADSDLALARPLLEQRGLFGDLRMLAITASHAAIANLHHRLAQRDLSALLLEQDDLLLVLLRETGEWLPALQAALGEDCRIGISAVLNASNGFAQSVQQARLALSQAKENGRYIQRYGEMADGLLPHSLSEARLLVERYLSALMDYDREHGSLLLKTLMQFLDNNSQYKATCLDLNIHRQTLVYRLKLIAQLSGLKPSTSEGLARLWLAVQAGRAAGLL